MNLNPDIFRKYDIRGIASTDLNDAVVRGIGAAFATLAGQRLQSPTVAVGRDMRTSSPRLFDALSAGLQSAGADVVDLGMVPTPLVYFSKYSLEDVDACIQITGSHNPGDYNGFKMMIGFETLHGDAIQTLRKIIESGEFADGEGRLRSYDDLIARYLDWLKDDLEFGPRELSFAMDCGNGIVGVMAQRLADEVLPGSSDILFEEPDGDFPNHHPDPTVGANLEDLITHVRDHELDCGFAYDGDGDRIGVVDENGDIIWGDKLMILLSRNVLEEFPGATIIGEVKCSQTLFDDIEAHGGDAVMAAVGHSLIKDKIKETDARLAGEMSGHIFFNDRFFGFDDAIYATCRVLEILSRSDRSLSELLSDLPETYVTPEIRRDCDESLKFDIPGRVAAHFEAQDCEVNTIDGARINFGDGWGLVRASNTQPVLVLRVEASTPQRRDEILAALEEVVARFED